MADAAPAFTIREIRPDEYEELGEVTVRAYAAVPGDDIDYHPQLRNVARRAGRIPVLVAVDPTGGCSVRCLRARGRRSVLRIGA